MQGPCLRPCNGSRGPALAPLLALAISTVISMPPAMPSHMVALRMTPALEQE